MYIINIVMADDVVQTSAPTSATASFNASAAAAGYAMQLRYALYCAIERLQNGIDWEISVEAGDDIQIVEAEGYTSYFQIKHRSLDTSLTDASTDLWKSLRIWAEAYKAHSFDVDKTQLYLVTTSEATTGSIAAFLAENRADRDVGKAAELLNQTAISSKNNANRKSYQAWLSLNEDSRIKLLQQAIVVCKSPDIDEIGEMLELKAGLMVRRNHAGSFIARLEGWWFQRCINIMRTDGYSFVTGETLDAHVADLRENFLPQNLPVDEDIPLLNPDSQAFSDYRFVRQIELVGVGASRIAYAVRDYLRAYTQRSRWVRESLLGSTELDRYERCLVEEWKYLFDRLTDEIGAEATEEAKTAMARQVYAWVEGASAPPIREQCSELFLVRGSLHMLADRTESGVGWHPNFTARLIQVLEPVAE
jgi:hypothetical protein